MSDPPDNRSPLQKLWNTYCSIRAEQGLDMADIFSGWAREQKESLRKFQAESSFENLCKRGCREFPLALALSILGPLKRIASIWASVTGPPRRREQRIRQFEKAATTLEELQAAFVDSLTENERQTLPPEIVEILRSQLIHPSDLNASWPKDAPAPHPSTTIRALRSYASFLRKFSAIPEEGEIGSSDMLWKYVISGYVRRATGAFHDSEVSILIGAVLGEVYDETAHRMWRSRNYKRLDANFSFLPKLLMDIGLLSSFSHT